MGYFKDILARETILESKRLKLRPFSIDDTKDVFLYARDNTGTKYLTWSPHDNILEIEKVIKEFYMNKPGIFAIELKTENKCIGCIELRLYEEHEKASFGYVLNSEYWNSGYMSEALKLILNFSFSELKLNRVESTYYVGNEASGRVMEKCGMKYEGKGLKEVKIKGTFYDIIHYGILKDDWIVK